MTSIVGVLCKDGIVLGVDSSATFGDGQFKTIEQPTEKLDVIADRIIVAGTGQIGLGQRFCEVTENAWDAKVFGSNPSSSPGTPRSALWAARELSRLAIEDFKSSYAPAAQYGALVAFPFQGRQYLCEFALRDFQPEMKTERLWYCSMGSAQAITDPFLALMREIYWNDGLPTVQEAAFVVTWTLEHAIQVNPGGVNGPIRIGVLQDLGKNQPTARILADDELDEHRQNIMEAKQILRDYRVRHQPDTEVPNVPKAG
jgi:hypothetical protein